MTAESFPTRARTTGFGLVDGVGHLGGGIGVLLIAPYVKHMSVLGALILISAFLVVAAVAAHFTSTRAPARSTRSPPERAYFGSWGGSTGGGSSGGPA